MSCTDALLELLVSDARASLGENLNQHLTLDYHTLLVVSAHLTLYLSPSPCTPSILLPWHTPYTPPVTIFLDHVTSTVMPSYNTRVVLLSYYYYY
jgi:hypothetical protein